MMASVSGRRISMLRALPGFAVQRDRAAQRLDVAADDVHADAAAAEVGDLLGGREARLEDQLQDVVVGRRHAGSTRPRSQARCSTLLAVDAAAVVVDADQDAARLVAGRTASAGPAAACRRRLRCSGVSRPWSSALRTRCISGSAMRSTTDLSSSVSPPTISSATSLPSSAAVSRTTRRKRAKVSPIGTMRSCSVPLRISSISRADLLVGLDQRALARLARQQRGAGAGDHQFAQQVDHGVEPVGLHADEAAVVGAPAVALRCCCRVPRDHCG